MRYAHSPLRPAMTAIAAVIALSSTPLFAQADPAPVTAPPVITAAPPVTGVSADATAPVAAPTTPASGSGLASVAMPDITTDARSSATDSSAAAVATAEPVARTKTKTSDVRGTSVRTTTQTAVAESPAAPVAGDTAVRAVTPPVPVAPAAAVVATTPAAQPAAKPAPASQTSDETAPIAGAAGLGLLALIGGAFALSRRKHSEEDIYAAQEAEIVAPIEPSPQPAVAFAEVPVIAPAVASEASTLPEGFDISHHGRHVQAAYAGPTPDNPSLSLRKRLKRASFYDQRERMAPAPAASAAARLPETPTAAPRRDAQIVSRPAKARKWSLRPAFLS